MDHHRLRAFALWVLEVAVQTFLILFFYVLLSVIHEVVIEPLLVEAFR